LSVGQWFKNYQADAEEGEGRSAAWNSHRYQQPRHHQQQKPHGWNHFNVREATPRDSSEEGFGGFGRHNGHGAGGGHHHHHPHRPQQGTVFEDQNGGNFDEGRWHLHRGEHGFYFHQYPFC